MSLTTTRHFWPSSRFYCSYLFILHPSRYLMLVLSSSSSNTTGRGAFTYATRVTGSWPIKSLVSSAQYAKMRQGLDGELAGMKLTPLQSAQYNLLKNMADGGQVGWVTPIALPRGGAAGPAAPNTSYITVAAFQMVYNFVYFLLVYLCYSYSTNSRGAQL